MAREIRVLKDKNNNDIEVYVDVCRDCKKEMMFPKAQADQLEQMFPFIKDKIQQGSPCLECAKDQMKKGTFNMYSKEEIEKIKQKAIEVEKMRKMEAENGTQS